MEPDELDRLRAAIKRYLGDNPEGVKVAEAKKVFRYLLSAACIFGHPRTTFGVYLMGIQTGMRCANIETNELPIDKQMAGALAIPALMTLLTMFQEDQRKHEMHIKNIDTLEDMTNKAEQMLVRFNKDLAAKEEGENDDA